MKLSLCTATYNEEENLHIPLDSAYDLADEIVIVDGGSEDRTLEIAKSYGSKVRTFSTDNPEMFHINKQKALEKARGQWILQLDADEALSEALKKEIQEIINVPISDDTSSLQNDKIPFGYWINRKNWFLTRFLEKGGIYPDRTIRLYRNGKARFPCKSVHENVEVDGEVGELKEPILHYADPTFERYLGRWNRYTTIDARQAYENGEELCATCYFIGKPVFTFLNIYLRHKGFQDGFPGFVWALFSSIRFWAIYVKYWMLKRSSS